MSRIEDFWDDWGGLILAVIISIVIFAIIIGIAAWLSSASCDKIAEQMGLPHQWSILTECMIQVDGTWLPLDRYIVNAPVTP